MLCIRRLPVLTLTRWTGIAVLARLAVQGWFDPRKPYGIAARLGSMTRSGFAISRSIDFGFPSTVGDPVFDAAVTASIFDMYGPLARDAERDLDKAITESFGYSADRMALYRAAYGGDREQRVRSAGAGWAFPPVCRHPAPRRRA